VNYTEILEALRAFTSRERWEFLPLAPEGRPVSGYPLGTSVEEPRLLPACVEDKNGHILPYVTFDGGRLQLAEPALQNLRDIADRRR
jgi:hypothetical protein